MTWTVSFAQAPAEARAATTRPFVLGVVEEFRSVQLKENRTLNIYLPAGYTPADATRYPVIYLLDGSPMKISSTSSASSSTTISRG